MTRALLLLLLLAPAIAGAQPAAGPSFDCARARAWDERMICGDRDLSALDRRVDEAFRRAVEATPAQRDRLQAEQRAWLTERRRCEKPASGTQQGCLRTSMASRATTLEAGLRPGLQQQQTAVPAPPPVPAGPAVRPVDCAQPRDWAAQRICASPALRQMDTNIARQVAAVRQRFATYPAQLREFETAVAAYLSQRQACARPIGRIPEDCIIETLEDADRNWSRLAAAPLPAQQQGTQSPAPPRR